MLQLLLTLPLLFADCKIPAPKYAGDACTISVDQVDMIGDYLKCSLGRHKESCLDKVRSENVNHRLAFIIPPSLLGKLPPEEVAKQLQSFFDDNKDHITDEMAKNMFDRDYKKPANPPPWNRNRSNFELDNLSDDLKKKYSRLSDLENEYKRLKIQARPSKAIKFRAELSRFESRYRDYIKAASQHGGRWNKISEPKVLRWGLDNSLDIANTPWNEIPDNFKQRVGPGAYKEVKAPYRDYASRWYDEAKKHIMSGGSIDDLKAKLGSPNNGRMMNAVDLKDMDKALREAGARHRGLLHEKGIAGKLPRTTKLRRPLRKGFKKTSIRFAGGILTLASLAVSAGMIYVKNQQSCHDAFPFYPTYYEDPEIAGLPLSMKCKMQLPKPGDKMSRQMANFLNMSYEDKYTLLNESSSGHSPCGYYIHAYNSLFCPDDSAVSESETKAID
ncbi:MAG: hypothetical protein KDD33_07565 [Bdellovibrionales bacterium]|nr:hypothetical protein [Bdellovibrionales bacterium]